LRALGTALVLLAAVAAAEDWPFGPAQGFKRKNLYNLGLLGAKASDADRKPAANVAPQGGKRQVRLEGGGSDAGPERLRIELIYEEGPADVAGLKPGDLILGVGSRKFSKGSLAPLAAALLKAESGKGKLKLLVQPGGAGATRKVEVDIGIAAVGKAASKPTKGVGRAALWSASLKWLAKRQQEDGGYAETLSAKNGAVVQTALAGLAWLGAGSDLENGDYKDNVTRAADWVAQSVQQLGNDGTPSPRGSNWNQNNWGYAHAAIFLGELHARTPSRGVQTALHFCAKRLVETQEESGGWAHGPGGPNALGYVELNIVTGLALGGLGLAGQGGFEVPDETLRKAEEYLVASSSGDGGVGYSTKPGQRGQGNIGRSAAGYLGYLSLGLGKKGWGKKMGAYVRRHAGEVLGGHASLMQHILLAGVAAPAAGKAAIKSFWEATERDLVLARVPDGSFQPRPWRESLSMGSNSDVTFGEVWTTAAWTLVLLAEPSKEGAIGYPAWSRK